MQGQGQVQIRRDAGQVVAGNAVTHIDKYINLAPRHSVLFLAFFSVRSPS